MNFYEQQLRNIFGNEFENTKYIGRACYFSFPDGNKVKAEFVTGGVANQYEALKLTAINRNEGSVDQLTLRFRDYFTRSSRQGNIPHIWDDYGKVQWYGTPLGSELAALSDAACDYVHMYEPTQNCYMEYNM